MNKEKVMGIQFRKHGRIYFYKAGNVKANLGDIVMVDTAKDGMRTAKVVIAKTDCIVDEMPSELKPLINKV